MPTEREQLQEARALIAELQETLKRLSEGALSYGVVLDKDNSIKDQKRLVVASPGGVVSVLDDDKAKVGEGIFLSPITGQILASANLPNFGQITDVVNLTPFGPEISFNGQARIIAPGQHKPKKGDRILLDPSGTMVLAVLESRRQEYQPVVEAITWDDVGGQDTAKRLLIEAVEYPRKHPKIFTAYGKKPTKGILMQGPPGCGKTMLAKAVATSVGSADGGFISVKGPEILDPYVGVAEMNVRSLFRRAEEFKRNRGREAVIFIDEAESVLMQRGGRYAYMAQTIVPQFLTEMDGLEESAAIVILATNRADLLDPAVVRDGRIDYKVEVSRPSQKDAIEIMGIHIGKKPVRGDRSELIERAVANLYAHPKLPHSGALVAGVVEKATANAIARDIKTGKASGLCHEDFGHAVNVVKDQESLAYAA